MSKYSNLNKDAITTEIKARRSNNRKISVDLRADEDTLRAALDADDVDNGDYTTPPVNPVAAIEDEKPEESHVPVARRQQIAHKPEAPTQPTQPSEKEWDECGDEYQHKGDGYIYEVVKRDHDTHGKTVKARVAPQESGHPGLYWEGSEAEFAANFEKL